MTLFFFLLYPFYLRDNKPEKHKGIWLLIGQIFKNRSGSLCFIILYLGFSIGTIVGQQKNNQHLGALLLVIWIGFSYLCLLWYPYHLKHNRPEKYTGLWRTIGEWTIGSVP